MANKQIYGKWESFSHNRREYNFNGRGNVLLVRNGDKIAVVKTRNESRNKTPKDFANEVEILASMDHPNIVTVLEYDLDTETPYMIMEFIEAGTIKDSDLSDWTIQERMSCFKKVCQAIAYVHEKGYRKQDIFRGNVFLREDKTPVIGDFEHTRPIENTNHIAEEMAQLAELFWEMMHEKRFSSIRAEERRLNEQIKDITGQLEELEQQKAELLN